MPEKGRDLLSTTSLSRTASHNPAIIFAVSWTATATYDTNLFMLGIVLIELASF
jgi:hypothetical protein